MTEYVNCATGRIIRGVLLALIAAVALAACSDSDPTGLDLPGLVEFRGNYTDASTCIQPGDFSLPITIWLFDYDVPTQAVRVAVNYGTGGSHTSGDQFRGTLSPGGVLQAFGYWGGQVHEDYEIKATVTQTTIQGNVYEYCSDGTADIWNFTAVRHE
ncbi:MAG TPA: hypothetical protein VK929_08785 [Longimicrobiales bacterium]|nr:hypothetical protein [Longimicrobiales bacterium]